MAAKATKVRLVRCPKCLKLLPELAHLPVYQCGGCGITLKAKRRPEDQENESSKALDRNSARRSGSEHDVEDKESTSSSKKASTCSADGCEQLDFQDCAKEISASRRIPNGIEPSGEVDWQEKEDSASRIIPNGINSSGELDWQEKEHSANRKFSNEIDSLGELDWQEREKSASRRIPSGIDSSGELYWQEKEDSASRRIPNGIDSSDKLYRQEKEELPYVAGGTRTPDRSNESGSDAENSTPDNRHRISGGINFTSSSQKPFVECVPSKFNSSSLNEELESEEIVRRYADLIGSRVAGKPAEASYDSITSKDDLVGNKLRGPPKVLKPAAAKSHHAYDASISSNDGWGDQASDIYSHQSKTSFSGSEMVAELVITNTTQNQARQLPLMSVNEKHDSFVGSASLDQDKLRENTRYDIQDQKQISLNPVQSWVGVEREELKFKKLFGQRYSSAGGDASKYRRSEVLRSSLFPPKKVSSVERDQMELLRKVDELRDQLNKSYPYSRKENERLPTKSNQQERQYPLYYNQTLPEVHFPRQPLGTYRPSKSLPFQFGYSQMPLSGNLTDCRHHTDCQCLRLMPPPNSYYGEGLYGVHGESRHPVENLQRREKREVVAKRHCRGMVGGAPFIICYGCRKVLFLPADFLLSRKRRHRLQCGSCSKVLMFTHKQRNHIAQNTDTVSTSFANDNPHGGLLSYSEDLELSVCKSGSTESGGGGLAFLMTGFTKKAGHTHKKFIQSSGSSSSSSDEGIRNAPGSPLHRLMGYSSITRILYGPPS